MCMCVWFLLYHCSYFLISIYLSIPQKMRSTSIPFLPEGYHWARLTRSLGIKVGLQFGFVLPVFTCTDSSQIKDKA